MERSGTAAQSRTAAETGGISQQTNSVRTKESNSTPQGLSLAAFPVNAALLLQNRSLSSWAAELTGLSPSRLRPGAKATFRESTLHRARERADALIRSLFFKAGGTHEAAERFLSEIPSMDKRLCALRQPKEDPADRPFEPAGLQEMVGDIPERKGATDVTWRSHWRPHLARWPCELNTTRGQEQNCRLSRETQVTCGSPCGLVRPATPSAGK